MMLSNRHWIAALALFAISCVPVPQTLPATEMPQAELTCAARGGQYEPVGMMGTLACVIDYADGGRRCTDGAQCQAGACIRETSEPPVAPGAQTSGACQRTNAQFGCYAEVRAGRLMPPLCVD